jgi:hypothetical protein
MFWLPAVIIIIVVVVGVVAKVINNLNEMNTMKNRPPMRRNGGSSRDDGEGGGSVRQTKSDMDRFLAEIDRLRKKNADSPSPSAQPKKSAPIAPVVQPAKQPQKTERPRARVVAELAEPPRQDTGFSPQAPAATTGPKAGDLPMATVVTPPGGTGAPTTTKVTRFANRPRPVAKTPFARHLTGLLNSGQGLAIAIVMQEILGPPRIKKGR